MSLGFIPQEISSFPNGPPYPVFPLHGKRFDRIPSRFGVPNFLAPLFDPWYVERL
jgi:hypothetical protein